MIKSVINITVGILIFTSINFAYAGNCLITNDVKVGYCADVNIKLDVRSSVTHHGMIAGAEVWSGGTLTLYGTSNGDIVVHQNGTLFLHGEVNGTVSNQGGIVNVSGHVNYLDNRYGKATLDGIANTTAISSLKREPLLMANRCNLEFNMQKNTSMLPTKKLAF